MNHVWAYHVTAPLVRCWQVFDYTSWIKIYPVANNCVISLYGRLDYYYPYAVATKASGGKCHRTYWYQTPPALRASPYSTRQKTRGGKTTSGGLCNPCIKRSITVFSTPPLQIEYNYRTTIGCRSLACGTILNCGTFPGTNHRRGRPSQPSAHRHRASACCRPDNIITLLNLWVGGDSLN